MVDCFRDNTEFLDESASIKCIDCTYPCKKCSSDTECLGNIYL